MIELFVPGRVARRVMLCLALGGGGALLAETGLSWANEPAEVKIDNFKFAPAPIKVKQGEVVTWVNHDDIPHSIVVSALQVHSHVLDSDQTFAYTFEKAGVYNYICGLHPFMKGQVVVTQ
jgi:amicyanin